jgi:hypothetical protein
MMTCRQGSIEVVKAMTDRRATPDSARALSLPFALRMAVLAGAVVVLAGCAGIERHTPASGFPDVLNAEAMADQSPTQAIEERPAPVKATQSVAAALPACAPASSAYRVRDLSVPWARRRYLLANGTICTPNTLRSL